MENNFKQNIGPKMEFFSCFYGSNWGKLSWTLFHSNKLDESRTFQIAWTKVKKKLWSCHEIWISLKIFHCTEGRPFSSRKRWKFPLARVIILYVTFQRKKRGRICSMLNLPNLHNEGDRSFTSPVFEIFLSKYSQNAVKLQQKFN